ALDAHATLLALHEAGSATRERDLVVSQLQRTGAIGAAVQLYRLAIEQAKPDAEREPGYQARDLPGYEGWARPLDKRYHPAMDRELQAYWLRQYVALPADQRIGALDAWLGGNDETAVQAALDRLGDTGLGDLDTRLALLEADRAAFEASEDPAIRF